MCVAHTSHLPGQQLPGQRLSFRGTVLVADNVPTPPGLFSPRVLWRLVVTFLPVALLTVAVVLLLYYQFLTNEHTLYEQAGDLRSELCTDVIHRELKSVEADLLILANQKALQKFLLPEDQAASVASRVELQDEYVNFCEKRGAYDQIRYLDNTGHERIRVNYNGSRAVSVPDGELQSKADRDYFNETMKKEGGEIFVSPFDLNMEHDTIEKPLKPTLRFATPIIDRKGDKRGILVLNYLGGVLLSKLTGVSVGFPGSVWLLNRDGFYLRGPSAQDEWGFMLGHDRTFGARFPQEWPRVADFTRGSRGLVVGLLCGGASASGVADPTVSRRGQFRTEHGQFTFRTLPAGVKPTAQQPRSLAEFTRGSKGLVVGLLCGGAAVADPAGPRRELAAGDLGLLVVAHTPPGDLEDRANRLLQGLLVLGEVLLILIFLLAWFLAYVGAQRRNQERRLADSAARLRVLSTLLLTAQEDERRSVARDLHDELGQVVTSVSLDLQRAAGPRPPGEKDELIGRAQQGATCLLDHIHEIVTRLRPSLLDDLGLKDAVQSLLSEYEHRTGIATRAEFDFQTSPIPQTVSVNVYRILQEALTNVSRHSRAEEVFVGLRVADGVAILTVRDNGVGLDPVALDGTRFGILGMRERAELLDGTFVVKTEAGRGTEVQVTIPIPEQQDKAKRR